MTQPSRLNEGRQWPLTMMQDIDVVDCTSQLNANDPVNPVTGVNLANLVNKMPSGAIIINAFLLVETAWDQAATLDIGLGTVGDTTFGATVALNTVGKHALTDGFKNVPGNPVVYNYHAAATPATVGHAKVVITYVVPGRATETI